MRIGKKNTKRQQRRKKRLVFFTACFSFLLVAGLCWGAFHFLPRIRFFQIQSIVVQGVKDPEQIKEILRRAELKEGVSFFSLDLRGILDRVKQDPQVDQVRITRRFPKTLILTVTLNEPRLLLNVDQYYYLGKSGKIYKKVERADSKDFPILSGLKREEIEANPNRAREVFAQSLQLLELYEKSELARRIGLSEIHYDPLVGFEIFPEKKKTKIIFGSKDFEAKISRLERTLEELQKINRSFALIDLNYEGKVILKL